ncbi:MAG: hypothetical protein WCC64_14730 [Aliidongia sp.]
MKQEGKTKMGEFDDKSGTGFQDKWEWPAQTYRNQQPIRFPNIVGKLVLLGGLAIGVYAYLAAHWGFGVR